MMLNGVTKVTFSVADDAAFDGCVQEAIRFSTDNGGVLVEFMFGRVTVHVDRHSDPAELHSDYNRALNYMLRDPSRIGPNKSPGLF